MSNREIAGVVGVSRPVSFGLGDPAARANVLNAAQIATIVRPTAGGYRLWGDATCASDAKWRYLSVVRIADTISDRLQSEHLWAVDRNITKTYVAEVVAGVQAYLRELAALGAILDGRAWADPAQNTPTLIQQGRVTISFDFTPPYPAEQITFESTLTTEHLEEVV